jgi:hypothetical protein
MPENGHDDGGAWHDYDGELAADVNLALLARAASATGVAEVG